MNSKQREVQLVAISVGRLRHSVSETSETDVARCDNGDDRGSLRTSAEDRRRAESSSPAECASPATTCSLYSAYVHLSQDLRITSTVISHNGTPTLLYYFGS